MNAIPIKGMSIAVILQKFTSQLIINTNVILYQALRIAKIAAVFVDLGTQTSIARRMVAVAIRQVF